MKATTSPRFQAACCSLRIEIMAPGAESTADPCWPKSKWPGEKRSSGRTAQRAANKVLDFIKLPPSHWQAAYAAGGPVGKNNSGVAHGLTWGGYPGSTVELLGQTKQEHILSLEAERCSPHCSSQSRSWPWPSSGCTTGAPCSRVLPLSRSPTRSSKPCKYKNRICAERTSKNWPACSP